MASKAGVVAGKAFVILEAIDGTAGALRSVERNLMSWGSRLQSIGARIFARGLTAMVPSALGTNVFKQFDDIMRRVQARTQGSAQEMQTLRNQAIGLGRDSAFSAREVAGLQDVLAQRKFNRTQIAEMTQPILQLGRAAGSGDNPAQDLLNSADLVSQAIMMYELEAKDAARVSDIFTAAANESNFALEDLIISMANGGPVAHQYGLSLEKTLAIMMVMRDLSIDSSVAGTGLRNLFLKASDKKAVEDFNKLMLEMTGNTLRFQDDMGNLFDPASILFSFDKLTKELGTAQRGHLLAELFGLRAITPATAVAANAVNFTDALAAVTNSAGETQRAYETMENGIGGVFRRLLNIVEGVGLEIGKALERPVIAIGRRLHSMILQFIGWISINQRVVVSITFVIAAVTTLGAAMFALGQSLKIIAFLLKPIHLSLSLFVSTVRLLTYAAIVPLIKVIFSLIGSLVSLSIAFITQTIPAVFTTIMAFISLAAAAWSYVIPAITAMGIAIVQSLGFLIALAPELMFALLLISPLLLLIAAGAFSTAEATDNVKQSVQGVTTAVAESIGIWQRFTQTVAASFNFVIGRSAEMAATVSQAFIGMTDALMAGDLNLAWEIAIAGMKLVWSQFLDFFWDSWFNVIKEIKGEWIKMQMWFTEMDTKWNPFADGMANFEKFNDLNGQLRQNENSTNREDQRNWRREKIIRANQIDLDNLTGLAARKKAWADAIDFESLNNPAMQNALAVNPIQDLIQNGAPTGGIGGASAINAAQGYTMEGARTAYENSQNRIEQLQNQELKALQNIETELQDANEVLNDIKNKPPGFGGV